MSMSRQLRTEIRVSLLHQIFLYIFFPVSVKPRRVARDCLGTVRHSRQTRVQLSKAIACRRAEEGGRLHW
eukprot:SAG11_NODE_289_length_11184_cov_20.648083_2_plen_70_part_00